MDRGMAAGRPAGTNSNGTGMIDVADVNSAVAGRGRVLRMAT